MSVSESLTERQFRVLEGVIQIYVESAQPAGSEAVARRSRLGISPASVRSTMGELEAWGYLFHAHTSGGRIPTERGYRMYVSRLMRPASSFSWDSVKLLPSASATSACKVAVSKSVLPKIRIAFTTIGVLGGSVLPSSR